MGSPVEETNPEFGFERFDLKCDRGLGKEKALRSLTKIQMLSGGAKDLETKVFELRHVMIIQETSWPGNPSSRIRDRETAKPMTIAHLAIRWADYQ
jgi:hypothetical protein